MNGRMRWRTCQASTLFFASPPAPGWRSGCSCWCFGAQPRWRRSRWRIPRPPRQPPLNLLQASERVRDALGGEVIKAELIECKGRPIYTIRLLQRGYIREVLVDAASGKMLLPEEDEAGMEMTD